jgi:hypothetical protein
MMPEGQDMGNKQQINNRILLLIAAVSLLIAISTRMRADTGTCGGQSTSLPFTDVPSNNIFFCAIAEAYLSGRSNAVGAARADVRIHHSHDGSILEERQPPRGTQPVVDSY